MCRTKPALILTVFLLLLFGADWSFGCTTISIPPVDIDPDEAVFTGKVTEIMSRAPSAPTGETIWGVRVTIEEAISLPSDAKDIKEYVVYLFALGPACTKVPMLKDWILAHYPPGTDVWVIGIRPTSTQAGELEVWEDRNGYLVNQEIYHTNATSVFDYSNDEAGIHSAIELRKDLLRLLSSRTERGKVKILKRLAFHPDFKAVESRFVLLAERHLSKKASIREVTQFYQREVKAHNPVAAQDG